MKSIDIDFKAKFLEVAAECRECKSALAAILELCPVNDPDINKATAAMIAHDRLHSHGTPAFDSFLVEERAQAIERGIELVMSLMNHQAPGVKAALVILQIYAARVRKEAGQ